MADEEAVPKYVYEGERATGVVTPVTAGEEPKVLTQDVTLLGERDGAGSATFANGDIYKGTFADGLRSGTGTYTYAAPPPGEDEEPKPPVASYEGGWKAGEKSNLGVMSYSSGAKYHGAFAGGKFDGQGTMFYANGDCYTGEWTAGQKNGNGTYIYKASGAKVSGSWCKNILVDGAFVDQFGNTYKGAFAADAAGARYVPGGAFSLASGATYTLPTPPTPVWENGYGAFLHFQAKDAASAELARAHILTALPAQLALEDGNTRWYEVRQ